MLTPQLTWIVGLVGLLVGIFSGYADAGLHFAIIAFLTAIFYAVMTIYRRIDAPLPKVEDANA